MKLAQSYIDEAAAMAAASAENSATEFALSIIEQRMVANGVEAALLRNALRLMESAALYEIAGLKREVEALREQIGEPDPLWGAEEALDARDRARDINAALRSRA